MGVGSYDESEQQKQTIDTGDENQGVNVHENDHEGELKFESQASTDDLVEQLQAIKADNE